MTTNAQIPPKPNTVLATPAQWQAITQRGNNLLVSASAGSGKTKVLVERIMRYIDAGVDIDHLLIVTFTEAAAKEMKERLRLNLEKAITKTNSEVERQRYLTQISLLPNATISTIHSFCMKVIRRYFYLAEMDPVFGLLDDVEASLLREKVWHHLQDELLENHSEWMVPLMTYFSSDRSDENMTQLVYQLYDFARSQPYPKEWLANLASLYHQSDDYGDIPMIRDEFIPIVLNELQQLVSYYDELLKEAELIGVQKYYDHLEMETLNIQSVTSCYGRGEYTAAYELANNVDFQTWPRITKADGELDEHTLTAIKALKVKRERYKELWKKKLMPFAFFTSPQEQLQQMEELFPIVERLSQVVIRFYDAYQSEKKSMNKIDFSDLEHDTLAILSTIHHGEQIAAKHYQHQFEEVLVDEYQDVNRVQEAILTSVCRGNNLFMVGDVKQSIYAFRLADPSLFREKYERYATNQGGERIILSENFRSRDQVLSFTNFIFRQIMDPELGQMAYDDAAALKTGNDSYSTDDEDKQTDIYILEKENKRASTSKYEELETEETEFDDFEAPEIHLIATKIRQMIDSGFQIMSEESTRETPKKRSIHYKDIVILVPTKHHNTTIEDILAQYHIPVFVQKNQNYFKRTEITTMMSALKMIDNPTQDIPVVAVLRSGMFGLDEVALAHIRKHRTQMPFIAACQAFVDEFHLESVDYYDSYQQTQLRDTISHFLQLLNRWRDMSNQYSLTELIWDIYMETHFLEYVHGQSSGRQRVLNLHALYERAKSFESSTFRGLRHFVRFIESMQKKKQDLEEPTMLTDDEDAVRVMTIHASKGLEYPVVFLMDTGHRFNLNDIRQSAIRSDKYSLALKHFDVKHRISTNTIPYLLAQRYEKNKLLSEEMRKLYVAMTRAREKLIIVGTKNGSVEEFKQAHEEIYNVQEEVLPYAHRAPLTTYLDWILLATMKDQAVASYTETIVTEEMIQEQARQWLTPQSNSELSEEIWLQQSHSSATIPQIKQRLQQLKRPYPHHIASVTASYQSVSEIKRMREEPEIKELPHLESRLDHAVTQYVYLSPELEKPQFLNRTKTVTSAQRGSGLHLLMQKLDLSKTITEESVRTTLQQLVTHRLLEREVADVIPVDQVLAFFYSPFGKWLIKHQSDLKREQAFSYVMPAQNVFKNLQADSNHLLIHGIIDGYVELKDQIILFDYKTDHVIPTQAGIKKVVDQYREQLRLYAEALTASTQKPVTKKILCLLSIQQNITVD